MAKLVNCLTTYTGKIIHDNSELGPLLKKFMAKLDYLHLQNDHVQFKPSAAFFEFMTILFNCLTTYTGKIISD